MKRLFTLVTAVLLALLLCACDTVYINPYTDIPKPVATFTVEIDGQVRTMRFVLDPASAPNTVSNFINLANSGYYDGLKIDYVYPTYYLRGGDPNGDGTGGPDYSIEGEFTDNGFPFEGIKHTRGVISMCRYDDNYNSAGSQFFVMLSTHADFNGKYAAFGQIENGDTTSYETLALIEQQTTDKEYRPLLRQDIISVRVDTKDYTYTVIKYGETKED